jgi:hypothetical protein
MKIPASRPGKILQHEHGLGLAAPTDVYRRARELARIEGRRRASPTDLRRAAAELRGAGVAPTLDEDEVGRAGLSRDPSEPPSLYGRQVPDQPPEDEQSAPERLVAEGVSEADHDQMLAARRGGGGRRRRPAP